MPKSPSKYKGPVLRYYKRMIKVVRDRHERENRKKMLGTNAKAFTRKANKRPIRNAQGKIVGVYYVTLNPRKIAMMK